MYVNKNYDSRYLGHSRLDNSHFCNFFQVLLSILVTIGELFLLVKGYYASKSRGWAMRLGKGGGAVAALLRNQFTFWSSDP